MEGLGILFDIDALGGAYGAGAWRIFMEHLDPNRLVAAILRHGDTAATLQGRANQYCIAAQGPSVDCDYIRQAFAEGADPGLSPPERRFVEQLGLEQEPLVLAGRIDAAGRFVEDEWSRVFHDRCKAAGWSYAPSRITVTLTPELRAELEQLNRPHLTGGGADGSERTI